MEIGFVNIPIEMNSATKLRRLDLSRSGKSFCNTYEPIVAAFESIEGLVIISAAEGANLEELKQALVEKVN